MIDRTDTRVGALGLAAALVAGAGTVWQPLGTIALVLIMAIVAYSVFLGERLPRFYLGALALLLVGYAFLGRGFAYLGVPPVFVGEVVLVVGLLMLALTGRAISIMRLPLSLLLVVFALWGAIRTVPYVGTYGIDALRDGVVWGYAVFALLAGVVLLRSHVLSRIPEWYGRALPIFLSWVPISLTVKLLAPEYVPVLPGTDVPILGVKAGDLATHLGGAGAFLLVGLHRSAGKRSGAWSEWLLWGVWLAGFLATGSKNRGGMLAAGLALAVVLLMRPLSRWGKLAIVAGGLTVLLFASNLEFQLGTGREVSPQQIAENVASITGDGGGRNDDEYLSGTRRWRLLWWGTIVDYTLFGEYFWTGKGFGINLADDDGFQTAADGSLRSPHNGHLTILARAGVPGLVLWLLLQGVFAWKLLRLHLESARGDRQRVADVSLWILGYWSAFMVNAGFDVFLEGPQGGIWFWSLFGFGLALLATARRSQMAASAKARIE